MLCITLSVVLVLHQTLTTTLAFGDAYTPGVGLGSEFKFGPNSTGDIYAVIFDAGSTGSRLHVYNFRQLDGVNVELVHETFEEVKPGLSNFSANPEQGAKSLVSMLDTAVSVVPDDLQPVTPLVLMATAGLRLLPDGKADNLLNEVTSLFSKTRFKMVEDSVQILEGIHEGIFSWVTVNYLEGAFTQGGETVAALDLGGGSTQITFVPQAQETLEMVDRDTLQDVSLFGDTFNVYTHSYLGLGLMSARLNAMGGKEEMDGSESEQEVLHSSCLPPDHHLSWVHHSGNQYTLKGHPKSKSGYSHCYSSVKPVAVREVTAISELRSKKIHAFSYFFDRAVDAGLIDEETGGVIQVKDYHKAANKACEKPSTDEAFLCLDLTYIYSLLRDGYQLDMDTTLHVTKKINKVELSWTLGAAFEILSSLGQIS